MAGRLRFTILGCGSSPGVPRITGDWGACDPAEPKNRRTRCSAMIERIGDEGGVTRVVFDTGPDFREQMIAAKVERLDAVVYTHAHADHIHGIDDLRGYWLQTKKRIPVHADAFTMDRLKQAFGYCFETPAGGSYPPIVQPCLIKAGQPFTVAGEGGDITLLPLLQQHGDLTTLGFRIGTIAYCPDVSGFPETSVKLLMDLDFLVLDALQYREHPSHFSVKQALAWVETLQPRRTALTHMHTPLDYKTLLGELPATVEPAFDGLSVDLPIA